MRTTPLKRVIGCILAMTMLFALAACGQQAPQAPGQSQETQTSAKNEETPAPETGTPATDGENGKTLVVYYSATGNTEAVAGYIADALGADTFELTPQEPYLAADLDYNNSESRVCREHENVSLQDVALTSATVEHWEQYSTVFVGYPIWWGGSAWPVNGFVKANDFTGKTVIPFCTSASSALGQSGETLAQLAGTGDWQEGQRFGSSAARSDVADWLMGLGFTVR